MTNEQNSPAVSGPVERRVMHNLKKCPFCGSDARSGVKGMGWGESYVACVTCGATVLGRWPGTKTGSEPTADEKWNTRVHNAELSRAHD